MAEAAALSEKAGQVLSQWDEIVGKAKALPDAEAAAEAAEPAEAPVVAAEEPKVAKKKVGAFEDILTSVLAAGIATADAVSSSSDAEEVEEEPVQASPRFRPPVNWQKEPVKVSPMSEPKSSRRLLDVASSWTSPPKVAAPPPVPPPEEKLLFSRRLAKRWKKMRGS